MTINMQRAGIIGVFLLSIYFLIYTTASWRTSKSFPERVTNQEVVRSKLDQIEKTLNKLGE